MVDGSWLKVVMKIDGKEIANDILDELKKKVDALKKKGVTPHLYIITFGENDQTESYLKQKILRAGQIGAKITIKRFPLDAPVSSVYKLIEALNKDETLNGIIVQRPLPKSLDEEKISLLVVPQKDVDGFRPDSPFEPPVALAVVRAIEKTASSENVEEYLASKKVTMVGKGITAGKPTVRLLNKLGIKFDIVDSKTENGNEIFKNSDIIISAVGKDKILIGDDIKNGAVLIGVGMHTVDGKLKGDYDESEIESKASFYTPTPGGIGPINVTMLMKNLVKAAEIQAD